MNVPIALSDKGDGMKFELNYSKTQVSFEIPDPNYSCTIKANPVDVQEAGRDEVRRSLAEPIGAPRLREVVKPGEKIVIITSDITRPVPSYDVIPPILEELQEANVKLDDITVVFALGSHREHTEEEKIRLVGREVYDKVSCIDANTKNCVHLGTTKVGTPVDVFDVVANADRRICVGNIEYHYFAGYSGGAKAIMPGVSTCDAIQVNHSMMVREEAATGRIEGNPVREDIDSVAEFCPIDYIVNVVLSEHKKILKSFAGHYIEAHRAGCRFLDTLYKVDIEERAEIVVASSGGYPKDLNLYQAQKGLDNAKFAVKDGGVIILVASCKEGLENKSFERWMTTMTPDEMVVEIKKNFELGGHKAAAIALVKQKVDIYLVSDLDPDFVRSIHLIPFGSVQEAVDAAFAKCGNTAKVTVMPYAGSTLPQCK